ncbi:hypothetical protein XELAEV_18016873mg [Xenopus laevis]|uniref:Uncharacterized protein n=1 Tax=Xenopus laevis TaxID=8355 RepID=A0A974DA46_XENLA|nr:hypothetical protein XELAEV_18016873mg [Xenopus laevis]
MTRKEPGSSVVPTPPDSGSDLQLLLVISCLQAASTASSNSGQSLLSGPDSTLNFPPTLWLLFMRDRKEFQLKARQVDGYFSIPPPPQCLSAGRILVRTSTSVFITCSS